MIDYSQNELLLPESTKQYPMYLANYLMNVDKSNILVSKAYAIAHNTTDTLADAVTVTADQFLYGLKIDSNQNFLVGIQDGSNSSHTKIIIAQKVRHTTHHSAG